MPLLPPRFLPSVVNRSASTVLVTGATGYVGGRLVPCLLREGYTVRCLVRDADGIERHPWRDRVEIAVGDALDPESLPRAMEGVDILYYLIHSLGAGEEAFVERDRRAASNVREAAEDGGVQRIVYLGGMRPKGDRQSKHLESRMVTGEVLRDGSIPVTEFRAAQIVGSGSLSFELVRYLTERVPLLICPRWVQTPTQPIAIRDVLQYLVAALEQPESSGKIIEIGGSDVLTYAEMFKLYADVRGLRRWVINVPVLTPRLSSHWIQFVTPVANTVARPLIEGLDNEVVVDDPSVARTLFPAIEPIAFEAALRLALRRTEADAVPTVWNEGNVAPPTREPTVHLELREGVYREDWTVEVDAPPDLAFDTVKRLGGHRGWLYGDILWRLRARLDRLMGGVGFRQGRRRPDELVVGDPVDFWRVESREHRLLRLRAEMKLPGRAWLQYEALPYGESRTQLVQTAFFEPKGLSGTLYWKLVRPLHKHVLRRQLQALADWIEERADEHGTRGSPAAVTLQSDVR